MAFLMCACLASLLRRDLRWSLRLAGCQLPLDEEERQAELRKQLKLYPSRRWVVRVPGVFIGSDGVREKTSFEAVVMAPTAAYAWEVANNDDIWTKLPFCIDDVQIFLVDPEVMTSDSDSPC